MGGTIENLAFLAKAGLVDFALLTVSLCNLSLFGALTLTRRKSHLLSVFLGIGLISVLWPLAIACFRLSTSLTTALISLRFVYLLGSFIPPLFVHIGQIIDKTPRWHAPVRSRAILYIPAILFSFSIIWTSLFVEAVTTSTTGKYVVLGLAYYLWVAYFGLYLTWGLRHFVRQLVHSSGNMERQLFYLLLSFLIPMLAALFPNIILPMFGIFEHIWIGPLFLSGMTLTIAFAILRHQLFDIRIVLRKSALYSVMTTGLFLVYFGIIEVARNVDVTQAPLFISWVTQPFSSPSRGLLFDWRNGLVLASAFFCALLGLLIFKKGNGEERSNTFAAFATLAGAWCLGIAMFRSASNVTFALFWLQELYLAGAALVPFFLNFSLVFLGQRKRLSRSTRLLIYTPLVIIVPLLYQFPSTIYKTIRLDLIPNQVVLGPGYTIYAIWFLLYAVAAFWAMTTNYINSSGKTKKLMAYVYFGTLTSFALGIVFDLLLPWVGDYTLIEWGPVAAAIFVSVTAYSILRFQLFDIRIILRKSLVYSVMLALLFIIYFVVIEVVHLVSPDQPAGSLHIVFFVAIGLISLLFPLLRVIDQLSQKLIFAQYQQNRIRLILLGENLLEITDLNSLLTHFSSELNAVYAPVFIDIWGRLPSEASLRRLHLLGNSPYTGPLVNEIVQRSTLQKDTHQLQMLSSEPSKPLVYVGLAGNEVTLCLFIGHPTHEEFYTFHDIPLLEDLCRFLGTSLRHALIHEQQRQLLLLKEHQIRTADAALSELEAGEAAPSPIAHRPSPTDEVASSPIAHSPSPIPSNSSPLAHSPSPSHVTLSLSKGLTKREIASALRKFDHPSTEIVEQFAQLRCLQRIQADNQNSAPAAIKTLLTDIIAYFKPANDVGIRTRNRIKYEILRMMAHDSGTEEQIMWELGFEPESDLWSRIYPDKARPQKYPYQGKGDYAATSRASFKRLKQEALADVLWKLGVMERD